MSHAYRLPGLSMASEFWLLCHGEYDGHLRIALPVVEVGLASALLAELVVDGMVVLHAGCLIPVGRQPPVDVLAHQVLDQVYGEADRLPVSTWLRFLARTSYDAVAARLVRLRVVSPVRDRRLLGRSRTCFVPADPDAAAGPGARLHVALLDWRPMNDADVFLAGLARACGLYRLLEGTRPRTGDLLDDAVGRIPVGLAELLAHTSAVIGAGVMTRT